MKVLLVVGAPHSSHEAVFEMLGGLGLANAQPSRYDHRTPGEFHKLILSSHDVDLAKVGPLESVRPGKLWSEMAVDLFMANINQPFWGWADHQTALLMDFWADFEPQVRFAICYDAPHIYLANALAGTTKPHGEVIEAVLGEWSRWSSFLLAQFQRNRDRTLLLNSQQALRNPERVLQLAGLEWQWTNEASVQPAELADARIAHHIARSFIPVDHVVWALSDKLDSEAHLRGAAHEPPGTSLQAAWAQWVVLQEKLQADGSRIAALEQQETELESEREILTAQLSEMRSQAEQAVSKRSMSPETDAISQQISALSSKIDNVSGETVRAAELVMENEHLMVALHQVQQELEYRLSERVSPPAPVAGNEAHVDLREEIDGQNWHDAEVDGRWAGPGTASSLKIPPLLAGSYVLELLLADAIEPDIAYGLRIEAFGTDVPFEFSHAVTRDAFPVTCRANIELPAKAAESPWPLVFKFPRTVSPADRGSDDQRRLAVRMSSIQMRRTG